LLLEKKKEKKEIVKVPSTNVGGWVGAAGSPWPWSGRNSNSRPIADLCKNVTKLYCKGENQVSQKYGEFEKEGENNGNYWSILLLLLIN
jgi:hypothetical protein